jgi:hypothetical protein
MISLEEYLADAVEGTKINRLEAIRNDKVLPYLKVLTLLYTPKGVSEHSFYWELFDKNHEEYLSLKKVYDHEQSMSECLRDTTIYAAKVYYERDLLR